MSTRIGDFENQGNSTLDRALTILEYISIKRGGVNLNHLVKDLEIPKSTALRLLESLRVRGYVELEQVSEKYSIGLKALEIGVLGLASLEIVDVASPYLRDISNQTGETAFLAVYNEGEIVYLYKVEGKQSIRTTAELGSRRPVHCTALGKSILSGFSMEKVDLILHEKGMFKFTEKTITDSVEYHEELSRVRENGYAVDDEEVEVGLICFSVPIFSYTGQVVAAISMAGPKARVQENREQIIESLKEAGYQISKRLGYVASMKVI